MMTPERLAEIKAVVDARGIFVDDLGKRPSSMDSQELAWELIAEVERLRAELANHHCESCDGSAPECWRVPPGSPPPPPPR